MAAVLVWGFRDQLGSSLICQLSLTELDGIRDEITLSKQRAGGLSHQTKLGRLQLGEQKQDLKKIK